MAYPVLLVASHPEGGRGFDPRDGTVVCIRGRLGFCMLVVMLSAGFGVGAAVVPARPAAAEDDCGKVIPYEAVAGAVAGDSSEGAYTPGLVGAPLAAGGATLSAATIGSAAAVAATFLASMYGTCRFLDWTNWFGSSDFVDTPTYGVSSHTASESFQCNTAAGMGSWSAALECVTFTLGTPIPAYAGNNNNRRTFRANNTTFSVGANSFPGVSGSYNALYPAPTDATLGYYTPLTAGGVAPCTTSSGSTSCFRWSTAASTVTVAESCTETIDVNGGTAGGSTVYRNIGGACGQHPQRYVVGYEGGSATVHYLMQPHPVTNEWGWTRRFVADVKCKSGPGGSTSWVQAVSGEFYDKSPGLRPQLPTCPDGYIPIELQLTRVPTPVLCNPGVLCYGTDTIITHVVLPGDLTEVATAPDWLTCLAEGSDCGAPELESPGVCEWGSFTVAEEFCVEADQANNGTDPRTEVRVSPTVDVGDSPVTSPIDTSVLDPAPSEPPPGGGVTVNVPINEGDGDRIVCEGGDVVPCIDDGDDGECFPNGWGWFNPVEWVERPVKCALVWAFVPSDPGGPIGEVQDELETQFPFSLGFLLIDFAASLGDELEDPSGTGCFDLGGEFSFGSFAVDVDDVCIGEGVEPGTPQRQLLATLMIAPLLWAVCAHAVRTMRGVSTE